MYVCYVWQRKVCTKSYACYMDNNDPLWRTRPRVANHSASGGAVGSVCTKWAPRDAHSGSHGASAMIVVFIENRAETPKK